MKLSTKRTIARTSVFSFIPLVIIVNICELPPVIATIIAILVFLCGNGVFFTAKCKFCGNLLFWDGNGNKGNIRFWKFLFGKDPIICHHCEHKNKIKPLPIQKIDSRKVTDDLHVKEKTACTETAVPAAKTEETKK